MMHNTYIVALWFLHKYNEISVVHWTKNVQGPNFFEKEGK